MRNPWGVVVVAVCAPAIAHAQAKPPFDSAIDVQTFEYAAGPKTFFTVDDGDVADKQQLSFDALITFLSKPFVIYNVDPNNANKVGGERDTVVSSLTAAQLTAAYGLTERLQLGFNLPIIFALQGSGLMPETGMAVPSGLSVTGVGDLVAEGKYRLYREGPLRLSVIGGVSLPTSIGSDGSQFIGDDLPTLRGRVAGQYDNGMLSFGATAGFILRKPRTIYDSTIGQQLTWGVAGAVRLTDRFSLVAEGYGRAGLPSFSLDASPLEVEGGVRVYATGAIAVVFGGGAGLIKGIGSPAYRFFGSIGYAPDVRDTDGDGIPNGRDKCPLEPEDKDGFQDEDGCPDLDNDNDGKPDATDKCPNEAEDIDGFEDDDGCPDLDNDHDGIPDLQDKCPNDPEDGKPPYPHDGCPADKRDSDGDGIPDAFDACPLEEEDFDGFEDGDGCPELDNDNDGIPDSKDKCPLCPEDKDGFQDEDGCPEPDNDHDGILDAQDRCPNEPETINGYQDADGCPDTGGQTLVKLDGDRLVIDKLPAVDKKGLTAAGQNVVDQAALIMIGHSEVTKWLIAVGLPSASDAKRVADAIKARVIAKGLAPERIDVLGAAGPQKIGGIVQERAAPDAPPVCPAGKEVVPRPEASKPWPGAKLPVAKPPDAKPAEPEIEIDK